MPLKLADNIWYPTEMMVNVSTAIYQLIYTVDKALFGYLRIMKIFYINVDEKLHASACI